MAAPRPHADRSTAAKARTAAIIDVSALPAFAYLALLHVRNVNTFSVTNLVGTALSKLMRLGNQSFGNMHSAQ